MKKITLAIIAIIVLTFGAFNSNAQTIESIISEGGIIQEQWNNSPTNMEVENIIDRQVSTKFSTPHNSTWVMYTPVVSFLLKEYSITSANDNPQSDPKNWELQGTDKTTGWGVTWTTLDSKVNEDFPSRNQTRTFSVNTNYRKFKYYRIVMYNNSGNQIQVAELDIRGETYAPIPDATFTFNYQGCGAVISASGTPPLGVDWFWQTSPAGTRMFPFPSYNDYTVYNFSPVYLRPYSYARRQWGVALKVPLDPIDLEMDAGEIGGTKTICSGSSAGTITNIRDDTGESPLYYWEHSDDGINWTYVPGNNYGATYNPGILYATKYYRREARQCGVHLYTDPVKITVVNSLTAGSINGNQAVCQNETPAALNNVTSAVGTSGATVTNYQWQKNAGSGWTNITANGNNPSYSPDVLSQTTSFRRLATLCNLTESSSAVTVTVYNHLSGGEIGGSKTICANESGGLLSNVSAATGADGNYTYQWEYSQDGSAWEDVSGESDLDLTLGALSQTTHYRRRVESCNTNTHSNIQTILVTEYPQIINVVGNGEYCPNTELGATISLATSEDSSVTYELLKNGSPTGRELTGSGSALVFENISEVGTYTVQAERGSCIEMMSGSVVVSTHPDQYCGLTYIPDNAFKQYLITSSHDVEFLFDDYAFTSDVESITIISNLAGGMTDLTGIEDFVSLQKLIIAGNQINSLNLSENLNLQELECQSNGMTQLILPNSANLTDLKCFSNSLTTLDISNSTGLVSVDCENNSISTILLPTTSTLTHLRVDDNQIETIDVAGLSNLELLEVHENLLSELDVTQNTTLRILTCENNHGIYTLDLSQNLEMEYLKAEPNSRLMCILVVRPEQNPYDIDHPWEKPSRAIFSESNCDLTYVPDDGFERVLMDYEKDDKMDDYVLTDNIKTMSTINGSGSFIRDMTGIEDFENLEYLYLDNNQIESLDLSQNLNLKRVSCSGENFPGKLNNINITQNTNLEWLDCYANELTEIDISGNPNLERLYCFENDITSLDLSNNSNIIQVLANDNQISDLQLNGASALGALHLHNNQLTSLDVTNNPALINLNTTGNDNLTCIEVLSTDPINIPNNWEIDELVTSYSLDCSGARSNEQIVEFTNSAKEKNLQMVYPNPAQQFFKLNIFGEGAILEIFDFVGNRIMTAMTLHKGENVINTDGLPAGFVLLRVSDGATVDTMKLFIDK